MGERMSREDRRDQLINIMQSKYQDAKTTADFKAEDIASAAKISVVWVYKLVGTEYANLREGIPGSSPKKNQVSELKRKNRELLRQINEMNERRRESFGAMLEEAISQIELLDSENRMLREDNHKLRTRLTQSSLIFNAPNEIEVINDNNKSDDDDV